MILVLASLSCVELPAQNPGYMGKKITAGYGFYFSPALAAVSYGYGNSIINTQHEFFLGAAIKEKLALEISAKFYKSTYENAARAIVPTSPGTHTFLKPSGRCYITARNYAACAKFFRSKYIAPWGRYFSLGLTLNTFESSYNPDEMYVELQEYDPRTKKTTFYNFNEFGATTQSFTFFDVMIGGGNSRIIGKALLLDYGYNINILALALAIDETTNKINYQSERYIESTSLLRGRSINKFNFFIKLGHLF